MTLRNAQEGREYTVKSIITGDEEMDAFLFSLGCYEGEKVTVISQISGCTIVLIKDAKYSIDRALASVIIV